MSWNQGYLDKFSLILIGGVAGNGRNETFFSITFGLVPEFCWNDSTDKFPVESFLQWSTSLKGYLSLGKDPPEACLVCLRWGIVIVEDNLGPRWFKTLWTCWGIPNSSGIKYPWSSNVSVCFEAPWTKSGIRCLGTGGGGLRGGGEIWCTGTCLGNDWTLFRSFSKLYKNVM